MLRVTIDINGHVIWQSMARRIHPVDQHMKPNTLSTYVVDESGVTIKHRYKDGAGGLAKKLINLWRKK